MVEMSYGLAGNGLKWPENQEISGDPRWPPPPLRRPIRAVRRRPAVKFHLHDRLDVLLPPVRRMYSDGGRNQLFWLKLELPVNWSKRPSLVLTGLGSFSRVFGAQSECLGLGFPLARKAMYI